MSRDFFTIGTDSPVLRYHKTSDENENVFVALQRQMDSFLLEHKQREALEKLKRELKAELKAELLSEILIEADTDKARGAIKQLKDDIDKMFK